MAKQKQPEAYLTNTQIRELKAEITGLEAMGKNMAHKIQDKAEFYANIMQKKKMLEDCTPKKLTGAAGNKALKRAREIEAKLKETMLSSKEYMQSKNDSYDFNRAVNYQVKLMTDPEYQKMTREYKNIMRQIDPSDPTISNIERLRR